MAGMSAALVPATSNTAVSVAQKQSLPDLAAKKRKYRAFEANKEEELNEARVARQYYHAKQWTSGELERLRLRKQAPVTDNRIARKIDFLVGIEQRMRRDPKALPRTPKHEAEADLATAGVRFVCDQNRWDARSSDGAHDGIVSGIGVIFVGIQQKRSGADPVMKIVDPDRFFYDPRSTKQDLSDARFMGVHLWMDVDEASETWPEQANALREMVNGNGGMNAFKAEADRATQWADFEHSRVRVVEMWERKGGKWTFCKFCGDVALEYGDSPYVDDDGNTVCPYEAWSPYIDEKGNRYGLIRNMKSMQDEVNHRRSKFLHLLNTRQFFARKGMLEDPDDFLAKSRRPEAVLEIDGEWGSDVGVIDQSKEIQGQAELLAQAQGALENLGPNPGLIGKGGGVADQSGRAILAQRDSGMTELSPVFERLRDWKLRVYRAVWLRVKQAWQGEKWIRVTDDERSQQFVGINQFQVDPMTGQITGSNMIAALDVDIILDEGPDTITMTEELLQNLSQIASAPPQLWKIMIELSNVPQKDRLLKMLDEALAPVPAPEAQPTPEQQAAVMLELEDKAAGVEQKRASVAKTYSDIESNRANAAAKIISAQMRPQAPAGSRGDQRQAAGTF